MTTGMFQGEENKWDLTKFPEQCKPENYIKDKLANSIQHGGNHYKKFKIQTWDYIIANEIPYMEGNIIKYVSRCRS
jgi:hypothetical protein